MTGRPPPLGASVEGSATRFRVWAPAAEEVTVLVEGHAPVALEPQRRGEHSALVAGVGAGDRYRYSLDGGDPLPDPASRHQPEGPTGPSAVVGPATWDDAAWGGPDPDGLVIYELHVGCFTDAGTFDAAIAELTRLAELGVTAIELMPIAEFSGARNWGYDGVFPSAAHHRYGGPDGLRRLVAAAHEHGLAVLLDVVYNHLGPEGNVLERYGPYFVDHYRTPWGDALNFSGAGSDEVRRYFIDSACWWLEECHVDGFRLDAIHAIVDPTARPFVEQLAAAVHSTGRRLGRRAVVIAESSDNDPRIVRSAEVGGWGLDGVWNDDAHHAVHTLLTGELDGYYEDYGTLEDLEAVYRDGWRFDGRYSPHRGRSHGRPLGDVDRRRLVVSNQNHDQIGNRREGERLSTLVDQDRLRLAAAALLLSPFTPMLFMGEEYGETAPFLYFVSHDDPDLLEAVRAGRQAEFAAFGWVQPPPDPGDPATFEASKLQPALRAEPAHRTLEDLHTTLLTLRREHPVLVDPTAHTATLRDDTRRTLVVARRALGGRGPDAALALHLGPGEVALDLPELAGEPTAVIDTARYPGPPQPARAGRLDIGPWRAVLVVTDAGAG